MIISLAQDNYVDLVLTGFNDDTYIEIQDSVIELFNEFGSLKINDYSTLNSISEKLGMKIKEHKLNNLKDIMSYIKILPDSEIFKLLDALILLTSIKMKFSSKVHSVGGKRVKVILRKFEGITFIE